jgi:hypothetical protein
VAYSSALKMEVAGSFETIVPIYQATRLLILEDSNLHRHLICGSRIDHKHTYKCWILGSHNDYGK